MPSTKPMNKMRCASPTAAIASDPSRPIKARSVVIIAIWPSWVSAIGHASLIVSAISTRKTVRPAGASGPAAAMVPGDAMARHHSGCRGKRKARFD